MSQFILQLAGHPGSGKSTLARAIGKATGALVLDKDVIKARMLDSGVSEETAAPVSYDVFFAVARSLAEQGGSVVLDSPAYFTRTTETGQGIADAIGADYFVIECSCPDRAELQRRLDTRSAVASQTTVTVLDDPYYRPGTAPLTVPHLQIDMTRPLEHCLSHALRYIRP
jgi:predicted kinase